ncbi:MAG: polysaccharide pyruvyl transferase CsaB [Lachnospiraceae bacterium]|nr:polysaccharide pyruvyl transferase CsaB [Lachnospiraceae bacterium]
MHRKYTILMALMGLEIGGAETHVVELAKQLNKEGHRIVVASNGGVYVKELEDVGIKHYKVPLNKRSIRNMRKSYFLLKDIIKKENPDIVHSHARIPGFVCGLLKKRMNFTFVTTAHWVFYTGMGLKYITNWGQKVVAVSDDIKDYLIKNYGVDRNNIYVTINGIDTDKFSPKIKGKGIMKEFNITEYDNTLVYVSRMDEDRALVAKQLIDLAPELSKKIKRLRILIVGGGNVFDKLKAKAEEANAVIGRECITMTGARTDINELIAVGRVFVGVSRAALEAMAAAKPVIIAGNEGYIGLFKKEKLELAQENNFCCRGCPQSTLLLLEHDIIYAMNAIGNVQRGELGEYGRKVIFQNYSVNKMASDCIMAYDDAWDENKGRCHKVLMSGYYGFNNSGDDAILLSIHANMRKLNQKTKITVLANNPLQTKQKYGVDVVYRYNIFSVIKAIKNCDVLISGGGSLLQDRTSTRSIVYYLSIIKCAKLFGKKVMLYANGIGPVTKPKNRRLVKNVVNKVDIVTLREENSLDELRNMGVDNPNAYVTADPVFTLDSITHQKAEKILREQGIPMDKPIVGVSVRNWKDVDKFISDFAVLCDRVHNELNRNIVFIPMQVPNDINISRMVQSRMKSESFILRDDATPFETMGIIGLMDFVMSMRLHTLIFAAKQRIPLIGFSYDPKIDFYLKEFSMPSGGDVDKYNIDDAFRKIKAMIENREAYVEKLDEAVRGLERLAEKNEDYLVELLEG